MENTATWTNSIGIKGGSKIHSHTAICGSHLRDHCDIGPNAYIGPYTSIGDYATILNTEVENTIIMEGAHIDCGEYIIDSLIGRKVRIFSSDQNLLKVHRRILGGISTVIL